MNGRSIPGEVRACTETHQVGRMCEGASTASPVASYKSPRLMHLDGLHATEAGNGEGYNPRSP
jgi:hypothetical protein